MKRCLAASVCCLMVAFATGEASAQSFGYGGLHPIHPSAGGGFCYTATPHVHEYPVDPNIAYLYRSYGGYQYFVGDPYYFGYEGQAFSYYGHHPLPDWGTFCYLDGTHYHHFLPPASYAGYYVVNNGAYYYTGVFAPLYYTYRTSFYRLRHTYWYLPTYRTFYTRYRTVWRTYARPASITYIRQPPRIVYRYTTRPRAVTTTVRTTTTRAPVYRYNVSQPARTYPAYYHRTPVRTTTTTTVTRPATTRSTTTTTTTRTAPARPTWRRR